jgi:STE24 endopeptidase
MTNPYAILIFLLLIGDFALDTLVDSLNFKNLSQSLPEEFAGLYEKEKYRNYLNYQKDNTRFALVRRTAGLALLLAFILLGGFNMVDQFSRGLSTNWGRGPIVTGLLFIGSLSLLRLLVNLPFTLYDTFVIEERYGFNKTTLPTFLADLLKGLFLGILLGAPVLALLLYFFEEAGSHAWLQAWLALTLIQIVLVFLAPAVIMPLFNKFEPLPEGELKSAIQKYAANQNFQLSGIFQMDGSKRSTKSNAFFTGFGKLRRLVLFDTLIQKHTTEELVAVLAHEIGHFKKRHILKGIALSIVSSGLLFYFLSFFIRNGELFAVFRMQDVSVYASLVFIGFLYTPVSRILSIFTNWLSRKHEFEADRYARDTCGHPELLVSALKKLSVDNLSHLTPHPLKVFLEYTHPPVLQRIAALRQPEGNPKA